MEVTDDETPKRICATKTASRRLRLGQGRGETLMHWHGNEALRYHFGFLFFVLLLLFFGCSTPSTTRTEEQRDGDAIISSIKSEATPEETTIMIKAPGARTDRKSYTLSNPPRICLDLTAVPADDVPRAFQLPVGPVEKWLLQDRGRGHTGLVIYVRPEDYNYRITWEGDEALLKVTPLGDEKFTAKKTGHDLPADLSGAKIDELTVLERFDGGTRLRIATDQPVESDISLEGSVLTIKLKDVVATTPGLKALEARPTGGVVQEIRAFYAPVEKSVLLKFFLRALAPYHVNREGNLLLVDFDAVPGGFQPVKAPHVAQSAEAQRIPTVTRKLPEAKTAPTDHRDVAEASKQEETRAELFESGSRNYAGQKMSFDFVDTDIRNILKLLAEVANLNIVWGTDVEGKISMQLQNVPWDQALEMVLKPNGLTYQIEDDVLWVVPRSKLVDMEIAEKKRKGALMAAKRLQGVFEAKVVEFILVRHRPVADIFTMLVGDPTADPPIRPILDIEGAESEEEEEGEEEKGKRVKIATLDLYLSYDSGTNMIIANGVRAKVDKVKELVAKLDFAQKQVVIEARVVEATTEFARDLGIQWQSLDGNNPGIERKWYNPDGTERFQGSFSTNAPASWAANIGLAFGWITDGGLGSLALDASLALAQEDQKAKIISAPKVMTLNNQEAEVARGTVRYFPIRTQDTIDYKEIPALLSLTVTPTVSADDQHITMKVVVTDDRELPATTEETEEGTADSPPGRTEKKITSTLIVRTGDTVVIGGIYQKSDIDIDSGIPWLKDIPVLGYLFKADRKTESKTELLIFLTPKVVKSIIDTTP